MAKSTTPKAGTVKASAEKKVNSPAAGKKTAVKTSDQSKPKSEKAAGPKKTTEPDPNLTGSTTPEPSAPNSASQTIDPVIPPIGSSGENPDPEGTIIAPCIVIPYLHEKASGLELLFSLRAWAKNFPDAEIVIIGDKPDFVSELVKHIPGLELGSNPQIDVAHKLIQAIASDMIPEVFVWSNDDIYPVAPTSLEDLSQLFSRGQLGEKKNATSGYAEKTLATKALLLDGGLPIHDYGTHLPVVYQKDFLAEILEKYKAEETGLLISSLYFNSVHRDKTPTVTIGNANGRHMVCVYRENPDLSVVENGFTDRKFVNHNSAGYKPTLPFLEKYFPDKSKFEK